MARRRKAMAAAMAVGGTALALGTGTAASDPVTETFELTGAAEEWVVPAEVCEVTIVANGAEGGDAGGPILAGLGGRVTATIAVTPGETLTVAVGGTAQGDENDVGGFNGGGDAGQGLNNSSQGSAGGGASDVRQGGADLDDRVVVAGGGGGRSNFGGNGGDAGGLEGEPGEGGAPGQGGTQTAGGAGGGNGEAGSLGQGGDAGDGFNNGGGGGGGGYYGGGGGAGSPDGDFVNFGTGGGGSSFGPADALIEGGVWGNVPASSSIDGLVEITYDAEAGTCPAVPTDPPAAQPVATDPDFTG